MKLPRGTLQKLARQDPRLGAWIQRLPRFTMEPDPMTEVPEVLTRSIVYQQLNGKAAETILKRFLGLLPSGEYRPEAVLGLSDAAARSAGLSGAKWAAIKDLAEKAHSLPTTRDLVMLSDEEIVERLTVVRGVGPWTVHMLLIFRLGRLDVLPSTDYGVRQGYKIAYRKRELPSPKALEAYGERWRPFRSVAAWYLWRVLESSAA